MTARERFIASGTAHTDHKKWVESGSGEVATQAAMMEFVQTHPETMVPGALALIEVLLSIHKPLDPPKRQVWQTLKAPS